ncbi:helix-turn-helix transcriptional regulator [Phascolarctobacterium sp.]|uniref:helix-turn-helix transcriptional regulator n=2 Tax=Phascolarctobacterium TaxID=33024 RepID=UPI0025F25218|nr:helix-turn-helix transcriptional regulator [Phascolarctobacterium sp.]
MPQRLKFFLHNRKKIWQSRRSLRSRFVYYLASLFLVGVTSLLLLLNAIGVLQPLNYDLERFMNYELDAHTNDIKRQLDSLAAHNTDLSQQLANEIEQTMYMFGLGTDFAKLNDNPQVLSAIQERSYNVLTSKMQQSPCSGVLYLVDASINTKTPTKTYNGMFLKYTNIHSENTLFNEICMFRGSPELARQKNISLYSTWQLELDTNAFPQTTQLLQGEPDAPDFLLTDVARLRESWERSRLFVMPIISSSGKAIGLCGFEISSVYFQQRTRNADYKGYPLITAILDKKNDTQYSGQLSSSAWQSDALLNFSKDKDYVYFTSGSNSFIGKMQSLDIGGTEHQIAVLLPSESYNALLAQARWRLALLLSFLLVLSIGSCYFLSKKYVEPIISDLQQLQSNPDAAPQSNLLEINQFFDFLQSKSQQQEEKLRQLSKERNAVQQQYGLAATRLKDAQSRQQAIAEQYKALEEQLHALKREMEQARQQMEQALQEKEQAQQQFNFAQTALDKVVAKKLQIIDHDSYKMFIDSLSTLTTKEKEIFDLYTQGLSTKDIIAQQQISENTLKYHNKNIYSKLGVKSRKELLQYIELMRNTR